MSPTVGKDSITLTITKVYKLHYTIAATQCLSVPETCVNSCVARQ